MSRRKSAARDAARVDHVRRLLRHGARFVAPPRSVVESAQWLAGLGIIELRQGAAVRCANPVDADFPPDLRDCGGLIDLRDGADEGGRDYRCPDCERAVFPEADDKERCETLNTRLRQQGVEAFLIDCCGELASGRTFSSGVLMASVQPLNTILCLVDYCTDPRWLRRSLGLGQPIVYLTAGPDLAPRILREESVVHVELAAVLLEMVNLQALLVEVAGRDPVHFSAADLPIYSLGAAPIGPQGPVARPERRFSISSSSNGFYVGGSLVIPARGSTAYAVMSVLVRAFAEAIGSCVAPAPLSVDQLADAIQEETGSVQDTDTIRRAIDRTRTDIMTALRRSTGEPIGDNDIIETVSRTGALRGAKGYRLNPATVNLTARRS